MVCINPFYPPKSTCLYAIHCTIWSIRSPWWGPFKAFSLVISILCRSAWSVSISDLCMDAYDSNEVWKHCNIALVLCAYYDTFWDTYLAIITLYRIVTTSYPIYPPKSTFLYAIHRTIWSVRYPWWGPFKAFSIVVSILCRSAWSVSICGLCMDAYDSNEV